MDIEVLYFQTKSARLSQKLNMMRRSVRRPSWPPRKPRRCHYHEKLPCGQGWRGFKTFWVFSNVFAILSRFPTFGSFFFLGWKSDMEVTVKIISTWEICISSEVWIQEGIWRMYWRPSGKTRAMEDHKEKQHVWQRLDHQWALEMGDEELTVWDVTRGWILTRSQAAYACGLVIRVLQVGRLIPNCWPNEFHAQNMKLLSKSFGLYSFWTYPFWGAIWIQVGYLR